MSAIGRRVPWGMSPSAGNARPHPFSIFTIFVFLVSFAEFAFQRLARMRRTELTEATMGGWARLNAAQRQRFFEAFVKAALRLERLELRAWLRRRLKNPPLAAPIDLARFTISDGDMALLMRAEVRRAPGFVLRP